MKSLQTTASETPKTTVFVVLTAILGVASMFVDSAEILGIPTEIVKWITFGVAAIAFVANTIASNTK